MPQSPDGSFESDNVIIGSDAVAVLSNHLRKLGDVVLKQNVAEYIVNITAECITIITENVHTYFLTKPLPKY